MCEQVWEYGTCLAEMEHACELAAMPPVTAKALPATDGTAELTRSDLYALHADCFPEHLLVRSATARCACCACCAVCCAPGPSSMHVSECVGTHNRPTWRCAGLWFCGATRLPGICTSILCAPGGAGTGSWVDFQGLGARPEHAGVEGRQGLYGGHVSAAVCRASVLMTRFRSYRMAQIDCDGWRSRRQAWGCRSVRDLGVPG